MKVYKVVNKTDEDNVFLSAWVHDAPGIRVKYKIGVKTRARIRVKGSPLMAFKDIESAKCWQSYATNCFSTIFECEAVKSRSKKWKFLRTSVPFIENNLKYMMDGGIIDGIDLSAPPDGSVLCSSITLIKEVK